MSRFYKYPEPNPRDYETEEDYQEALDDFYAARRMLSRKKNGE